MTINFGGEAWVSHVMLISVSASVSYILPRAIYCAYLPGLFTWNMIYSLGTAPRAPNIKLFFLFLFVFVFCFFQIFNSNARKNRFQLVRAAFPSFFCFLSFFLFFLLIKAGSFFKVQGARSLVSLLQRSRRTQILLVFSVTLLKIDQNKNQNHSTDKVQNLGNERR